MDALEKISALRKEKTKTHVTPKFAQETMDLGAGYEESVTIGVQYGQALLAEEILKIIKGK